MTDKEKKIREVYDKLTRVLTSGNTASPYDMAVCTANVLNLLSSLYEAGYVAGELSNIND